MQAILGKAEFAWGVRGNMFSFLLLWEKVELMSKFEDGDLSEWPLSLGVLCHIVRLRLVRGPEDLLQKFKDLHARSGIVKKLVEIYIDRHVADLADRLGVYMYNSGSLYEHCC